MLVFCPLEFEVFVALNKVLLRRKKKIFHSKDGVYFKSNVGKMDLRECVTIWMIDHVCTE